MMKTILIILIIVMWGNLFWGNETLNTILTVGTTFVLLKFLKDRREGRKW